MVVGIVVGRQRDPGVVQAQRSPTARAPTAARWTWCGPGPTVGASQEMTPYAPTELGLADAYIHDLQPGPRILRAPTAIGTAGAGAIALDLHPEQGVSAA